MGDLVQNMVQAGCREPVFWEQELDKLAGVPTMNDYRVLTIDHNYLTVCISGR